PRRSFVLSFAAATVIFMWITGSQATSIQVSPQHHLATAAPIGVHANQLFSSLAGRDYALTDAERTRVQAWLTGNSKFSAPAPAHEDLRGILERRDIYIVLVESLEEVVIGLKVEGQEVTPNINSILGESLVFPNVVQQTRDGNTADAQLMVLTGLY